MLQASSTLCYLTTARREPHASTIGEKVSMRPPSTGPDAPASLAFVAGDGADTSCAYAWWVADGSR